MMSLCFAIAMSFLALFLGFGLLFTHDSIGSLGSLTEIDRGFMTDRLLEEDMDRGATPLINRDMDKGTEDARGKGQSNRPYFNERDFRE